MVNGSLRQKVIHLAQELHEGETIRTVCPNCNGGSTGEKTFVITAKKFSVLYCCFRGKCGVRGMIFLDTKVGTKKPNPIRKYTGSLLPVPMDLYDSMYKKYGIRYETLTEQGITFANDIARIRVPIYNNMGYVIGESLRAILKSQKPKTLINKWSEVPLLHFPLGQTFSESIVLVEDQTSALKVSEVAHCAALLGTFISDDGLTQLKRMGIKTVYVILDGDVPGMIASMELVEKLSPFFKVVNLIPPTGHDPKDLSLEYIQQRINNAP